MKNRDQIIKESSNIAYSLIDPNLFGSERVIIVESIIQLEILIDAIITIHFFKLPSNDMHLLPSHEHFERFILSQYNLAKKIELLNKCNLIDNNLKKTLNDLRKLRNDVSHSTICNDDLKKYYNDEYVDLNIKFINEVLSNNFITTNKIKNINYDQVNQHIQNFVNCYSKLISLLINLKENKT